jgi:hypothetical protein
LACTPPTRGGENYHLRAVPVHPALDAGLLPQVEDAAPGDKHGARLAPQAAHHGASHHAVVACHPDSLACQVKVHPINLYATDNA